MLHDRAEEFEFERAVGAEAALAFGSRAAFGVGGGARATGTEGQWEIDGLSEEVAIFEGRRRIT